MACKTGTRFAEIDARRSFYISSDKRLIGRWICGCMSYRRIVCMRIARERRYRLCRSTGRLFSFFPFSSFGRSTIGRSPPESIAIGSVQAIMPGLRSSLSIWSRIGNGYGYHDGASAIVAGPLHGRPSKIDSCCRLVTIAGGGRRYSRSFSNVRIASSSGKRRRISSFVYIRRVLSLPRTNERKTTLRSVFFWPSHALMIRVTSRWSYRFFSYSASTQVRKGAKTMGGIA